MSGIDSLLNSLMRPPGMRVMHFCESDLFCKNLSDFCKDIENSEYQILTFSKESEELLQKYKNSYTKLRLVSPQRPKYNIQGKLYDYLFITVLPQDRESFFKRVYSALKNAGLIFIFLEKNQKDLAYKIEAELIECNYVATSRMDLNGYLIVSGKKMHGWSKVN